LFFKKLFFYFLFFSFSFLFFQIYKDIFVLLKKMNGHFCLFVGLREVIDIFW